MHSATIPRISSLVASFCCLLSLTALAGCNEQGAKRAERSSLRWDGQKALESHHWAEAVGAYTKLIEQDPKRGDYYQGRATAYNELDDYAKALADYKTADELGFPNKAAIAKIAFLLGNTAEAAAQYKAAIEAAPQTPNLESAMYCALAYKLERNTAEAEKVAEQAMDRYAHDIYVVSHKNDKEAQKYIWEKWPYPALQYLRGTIDAEKMIATTADNDWNMPEAHLVAGMNLLATDHSDQAVKELQYVADHAKADRYITKLARFEMGRIARKLVETNK